jgi:transcriptional regulator with XRE-family HTH domain
MVLLTLNPKRIAVVLRWNKVTAEQLAKTVGWSDAYMKSVLNGKEPMDEDETRMLAQILGTREVLWAAGQLGEMPRNLITEVLMGVNLNGKRIKEVLSLKKLTITEAAEMIGMSRSHFSEALNGQRPLPGRYLKKLIALFGADIAANIIDWGRIDLSYPQGGGEYAS